MDVVEACMKRSRTSAKVRAAIIAVIMASCYGWRALGALMDMLTLWRRPEQNDETVSLIGLCPGPHDGPDKVVYRARDTLIDFSVHGHARGFAVTNLRALP